MAGPSTSEPAKRRPGRPPKPEGERLSAVIPPQRVSQQQREKFERLGGATWLRRQIDRAREPVR